VHWAGSWQGTIVLQVSLIWETVRFFTRGGRREGKQTLDLIFDKYFTQATNIYWNPDL